MKKTPAIPFPAPEAGVVISEHPKQIGIQGCVDAKNFVKRRGSLVTRPGLERLITVDFDTPWSSAAPPSERGQVLAMASYDYQKEGVATKDRLLAVMRSAANFYDSDLSKSSEQKLLAEDPYDWGWDVVYGQDIQDPAKRLVPCDDLSVDVTGDGINWSRVGGSNIVGVGVSLFYNPTTGDMVVWMHPFSEYTTYGPLVADRYIIDKLELDESGASLALTLDNDPLNILVTCNANTEIYKQYVHFISLGDDSGDGLTLGIFQAPIWYKVFYRSSKYGFPRETGSIERFKIDYDEDDRPVIRTWDYAGETHAIVSAKGEWILDMYGDPEDENGKVNTCGPPGICPKAVTIAVAGQRIVAGNVTFFNVSDMIADEDNYEKITRTRLGQEGNYQRPDPQLHSLDDTPGFAYISDAVIFSQTVLQAGHLGWYPGDILRLADTPGEIVAMQEIGTMQCAVYKTDAIYVLTTQAGLSPFAPSVRATGIEGPVGPKAVVAITDSTHVYLARDGGVYIFDGGPPKSLGDHFKEWVGREIDPDHAHKTFSVFNKEEGEVLFMYPVRGSKGRVRRGVAVDIASDPFRCYPVEFAGKLDDNWSNVGTEDVDYTCAVEHFQSGQPLIPGTVVVPTEDSFSSETTYQEFLIGVSYVDDSSGKGRIFRFAEGGSDFGIPIEADFTTGMTDFGNPDQQKVLLEIEHLIDPEEFKFDANQIEAMVTLYAGNSDRDLRQVDQQMIDLTGEPPYVSYHRTSARYFSYELSLKCSAAEEENGRRGSIAVGGGIARFKPSGYRNAGIKK